MTTPATASHGNPPHENTAHQNTADQNAAGKGPGPRRRRWFLGAAVAVGITGVVAGGVLVLSPGAAESPDAATPGNVDQIVHHQQHEPSRDVATSPTDCPQGTVPLVDLDRHPEAHARGGADTPEAAVHDVLPDAEQIHTEALAEIPGAPVWVEADGATYEARTLDDDTWFLSPATFRECTPIEETGIEHIER